MTENQYAKFTVRLWREIQRADSLRKQFKPRKVHDDSLGIDVLIFKTKRQALAYNRVTNRMYEISKQIIPGRVLLTDYFRSGKQEQKPAPKKRTWLARLLA